MMEAPHQEYNSLPKLVGFEGVENLHFGIVIVAVITMVAKWINSYIAMISASFIPEAEGHH